MSDYEEDNIFEKAGPHERTPGQLGVLLFEPPAPWYGGRLTFVEYTYQGVFDGLEGLILIISICFRGPGEA